MAVTVQQLHGVGRLRSSPHSSRPQAAPPLMLPALVLQEEGALDVDAALHNVGVNFQSICKAIAACSG